MLTLLTSLISKKVYLLEVIIISSFTSRGSESYSVNKAGTNPRRGLLFAIIFTEKVHDNDKKNWARL